MHQSVIFPPYLKSWANRPTQGEPEQEWARIDLLAANASIMAEKRAYALYCQYRDFQIVNPTQVSLERSPQSRLNGSRWVFGQEDCFLCWMWVPLNTLYDWLRRLDTGGLTYVQVEILTLEEQQSWTKAQTMTG